MARLKKHIRKKKAIIRKQIKRTNNRNQSHNTKTAEQQSRDNEMLKVMLGRPQQIIPGQTQQNDKLQQQIETTNKAIGGKSYVFPLFPLHFKKLMKRFFRVSLIHEGKNQGGNVRQ